MTGHRPPKFFDGGGYEKMMGRWSQVAGMEFLEFLDPAPGGSWLDVGCGNGAFSELLFARAGATRVEGIDPSEGLLEAARKRLSGHNANFASGDAQSLPFGDDSFDASVMALVINFIPEPRQAVGEMVRVTKPGGSVSSYIWDIKGGGFTMEPIREALKSFGIDAPVTGPEKATRSYMERVWRDVGLQQVTTTRIEIPLIYENFEDFWTSNTGIPNSVANAVSKMQASEVARLKDLLLRRFSVGEAETITYNAAVNAVKGSV